MVEKEIKEIKKLAQLSKRTFKYQALKLKDPSNKDIAVIDDIITTSNRGLAILQKKENKLIENASKLIKILDDRKENYIRNNDILKQFSINSDNDIAEAEKILNTPNKIKAIDLENKIESYKIIKEHINNIKKSYEIDLRESLEDNKDGKNDEEEYFENLIKYCQIDKIQIESLLDKPVLTQIVIEERIELISSVDKHIQSISNEWNIDLINVEILSGKDIDKELIEKYIKCNTEAGQFINDIETKYEEVLNSAARRQKKEIKNKAKAILEKITTNKDQVHEKILTMLLEKESIKQKEIITEIESIIRDDKLQKIKYYIEEILTSLITTQKKLKENIDKGLKIDRNKEKYRKNNEEIQKYKRNNLKFDTLLEGGKITKECVRKYMKTVI